ncbi:MAG: NAD(P)-dependent oxidoreductase [Dongiaceae bacterium]
MAAKKTRRASTRHGKIHLHIENTGRLDPVFQVTAKRLEDALKNYPQVARRLTVSLGQDGDIFDRVIGKTDVLFGWNFDRRDLKNRAPRLKWAAAHAAGVGHLMPLDWLPKGAVLTNSSGVHGDRATEYLLMALLMLNNRLPEMATSQRLRRWKQEFNSGIAGKTLLIIGVGSIGGGAAKWAKRLGLTVLGIRRTGRRQRYVDRMYRPRDLRRLLPRADFIMMTTPYTKDTHHMLGAREIALIKRGAGLINYSRAKLVDYEALRKRLVKREISAVLDVFSPEPLPSSSPLWHAPNLVITPHCSSDDTEAYTPRTLDLLMRNMARFMAGKKLMNRVSAKYGY